MSFFAEVTTSAKTNNQIKEKQAKEQTRTMFFPMILIITNRSKCVSNVIEPVILSNTCNSGTILETRRGTI